MREQLSQYVNLLFAGEDDAGYMKEEILQNTLDRYDDLLEEGKTPEVAYRMAIAGIGDPGKLLGISRIEAPGRAPVCEENTLEQMGLNLTRLMRAIAIGLYILSPAPLIALDTIGYPQIGLCLCLMLVAAATMLILLFRGKGRNTTAHQTDKQ